MRYHSARVAARHARSHGSAKEKRIAQQNLEFVRKRYEELRAYLATVEMDVYRASIDGAPEISDWRNEFGWIAFAPSHHHLSPVGSP